MKFKSLYLLGFAALAFSACDDTKVPEYVPAPESPVGTVYFNDVDKKAFVVGETATSVTTLAYRPAAGTNETYPLAVNVTYTDPETEEICNADNLFTYPTSVTFGTDDLTAPVEIGFDVNELVGGLNYNVNLKLGDENTPYYSQETTITVRFAPWEDVVGPNGETKGKLYDCFLNTFANIGEFYNEVLVQESPVMPGFYRVVNPYQPGVPAGYIWPADEEYEGDYYMYINATDPKNVFICSELGDLLNEDKSAVSVNLGVQINFSDGPSGPIVVYPSASFFAARGAEKEEYSQYFGTLTNGQFKFSNEKSFLVTGDAWYPSLYYAPAQDFLLILPGMEKPIPWEELGDSQLTDGFIGPLFEVEDTPMSWTVYTYIAEDPETGEVLYKLENPWKDGICPYGVDYDDDVNIIIDASNPDCLRVKDQFTGVTDEEAGELWVVNYAVLSGRSDEDIIKDKANDVLKDNVMTFGIGNPTKGWAKLSRLIGMFPFAEDKDVADGLYPTYNETIIALPGAGEAKIKHRMVTNGASFVGKPDKFQMPNEWRSHSHAVHKDLRPAVSL